MIDDKETLINKLLFEEFLDWFGKLSKTEKLVFNQEQSVDSFYSEQIRGLDYYTMGKSKTYFEENIWPQRVEEKLKNIDRLLKQHEEIAEQPHVTIVNKKILLSRKITT